MNTGTIMIRSALKRILYLGFALLVLMHSSIACALSDEEALKVLADKNSSFNDKSIAVDAFSASDKAYVNKLLKGLEKGKLYYDKKIIFEGEFFNEKNGME